MPQLVLVVDKKPLVVPLKGQEVTIGRSPENTVVLERPSISRQHCRLEPAPGGAYRVVDVDSTNGTYLNGELITHMTLDFGDRIVVGQVLLLYLDDDAEPMKALETSGVVFPWGPAKGEEVRLSEPRPDVTLLSKRRTMRCPIVGATNPEINLRAARAVYLKELLPRLSRVGQNVASEMDLGRLMSTILAELSRWTGCERALLLLYDEDTGLLQPVLGHSVDYEELEDDERVFLDQVVKRALENKMLVTWARGEGEKEAEADAPQKLRAAMCLPMTVPVRLGGRERRQLGRTRRSLGAIYLDSDQSLEDLDRETLGLLEAVAAQAVTALQNAQLHHQATTDAMTGLYNRMFIWQLMSSELRVAGEDTGSLGLILLDLDRLKQVNDTWGHLVGDEVIKRVARRIKHTVRKEDFVARWGGEEFVVVLMDQPIEGILTVARKIREAISGRPIGEHRLRVSACMGIAVFPDHAKNMDDLVRCADTALYEAKQAGRGQIKVHLADEFH